MTVKRTALCPGQIPTWNRREFLTRGGLGFGSLALASLLNGDAAAVDSPVNPLAPRRPHFPPQATSVIFLFMAGGPSQVDTFAAEIARPADSRQFWSGANSTRDRAGVTAGLAAVIPSAWRIRPGDVEPVPASGRVC